MTTIVGVGQIENWFLQQHFNATHALVESKGVDVNKRTHFYI